MPLNPGDPIFNGTSGSDSFSAPSGNSGINGFGGTDTVTFSFNLVDAVISYSGPVVIIDTATSHTELTGIETYHFADGTVSEDDGTPLVADLYYYGTYHDIWNAGADADLHYNGSGWHEHRNPNPFFNTDFYLSLYQDTAGLNPLTHYSTTGWTLGRIPSPLFDPAKYKAAYPDVAAAGIDPLLHFLTSGVEEGRVPFPVTSITSPNGFDALYYLTHYPDVAAAHADPFVHFMTSGWHEGRNPNAYFDTRGYLATYVDVAMAGVNPLDHFHNSGWKEGRIPSPGFDPQQYLAVYTDVAAAGVDPLAHFLSSGINEGRVAFPEPIFDTNGAADIVLEGAAAGTGVGIAASWGNWISPALSFSITGDSSGGGFGVNAATGQIVVADSTKLDFETSGASHSYVVTVVAHDGELSHSQTFTVGIGDVIPTTPVDGNAGANTVVEGAANGSTVGVTLFSNEPNGPPVVYELTDTAGGRFAVNSSTGVVTVANSALLDFETGAHSFTITGRTQVGAVFTPTQSFTINLTNANPSPISDSNAANETVDEGAAVNTLVGIDADSTDPNGPAVIWSITSDTSGGGFKIDSNGVVSVADASKIDYEGAPGVGHSYSIIVQASDGVGGVTSRNFSIVVNNLNPTTPVEVNDGTPGGNVTEGAAVNTLVGIDVNATDVNGPAVTWSITNDPSGGGFKIDSNGVISVANAGLIDFEGAGATHTYALTVQAADGQGGTSSAVFNVVVGNVAPTTPTEVADGTAGGNVSEGASNGALVGITAASTDVNGPPVIWSITNDTSDLGSGGAFTINSSGVVSVADATKLNYETAPGVGRSYDITVQASDGFASNSAVLNILVGNVNPQTPADGDPTNDAVGIQGQIVEGAAAATGVGIDANALDPNGPPVSWSILSGSASGAFQIDANGVVTVLNGALLNFETAPSLGGGKFGHTILVQASDGAGGTSTQTFTIELTNAAPAAPSDTDPVGDGAGTIKGIATDDATAGTQVGIHAQSTGDPAGGAVTYELAAGSSTFFQIDANTGVVSVSADGVGDLVEGTNYDIFVVAKDSTGLASGTSSPPTQFTIRVPAPGVAAPQDVDGATNGGLNQIAEDAVGIPGNFGASAYTGIEADSATATSYSISTDTSGGGFQIDPTTGRIYVANGALIDFESAPSNKYTVTVVAADSVTGTTASTDFDITVLDVAPTTPIDGDPSAGVLADPTEGRVALGAANGSNVGITVASSDIDGGALTYEFTSNPGNRFAIDATTGDVTLADNSGLVAGTQLTFSARAVSTNGDSGAGTNVSAAQAFVVDVVSNQPLVDLNGIAGVGSTGIDFSNSFAEDGADAAIADTDAAVVYPGFTNLTSATITLTNAQVGDALAVGTPGTLTVNTVSGGGKITVTLTGNAAFSVYETALSSITFENTSNTPVTGDRTITVVVSDGVNPPSNAATSTITVIAANDAPVLTPLATAGFEPYTENGLPAALLSTGDVTDADNPASFVGGGFTVAVTGGTLQTGDQIIVLASSGFSVSGSSLIFGGNTIGTIAFASGSATVTNLTANATPTVVDALVKAFGFQSSSENPTAGLRTINFTFNDGGNTGTGPGVSNVVSQDVNVTAVNDAPVIGTLNGDSASFTEAGPAVLLDTGTAATVTDVDSANFDNPGSLTVSITGGGTAAEDVLGISATGGITTSGTAAGSTVSFGGTVIGTIALNGTGIGENLVISFDPDATPAAVQALVRALTYDNTNGTTASTATRAISVTLTDGDGGSTLVDTTVSVSGAVTAGLTGQLWYVTREGDPGVDPGTPSDNWIGHLNSDGSAIAPEQDMFGTPANDVGVDTAAGLYFVLDDTGLLTSYSISAPGVALFTSQLGSGVDFVDSIAVDTVRQQIFVGISDGTAETTGIRVVSYVTAPGATYGDLSQVGWLLTQETQAIYHQGLDFSIDLANQRLYYIDNDLANTNAIYVVDYAGSIFTDSGDVTPDDPAPVLVSDAAQFPVNPEITNPTPPPTDIPNPDFNGFIQALAVDTKGNSNANDDIVYFLTTESGLVPPNGSSTLWYIDRFAGDDAALVTLNGFSVTGVGAHSGLTFDPLSRHLYISDTANGLLQVSLNTAGDSATFIRAYSVDDLSGQTGATSDPGAHTLDVLPTLTVAASATFTELNPVSTPVTLSGGVATTLTDPEGYLAGATITVTGGFAGDGDALNFTAVGGISLTGGSLSANASGNITVTFTGYALASAYETLLESLTFTSGDNPTNFGSNTTRTVTWHVDDGAPGDPHSSGNTKTSTINITAANDAPTLDLDTTAGNDYTTSYQIGDPAVAVTGTVDIVDVDNATIASATVTLTNAQTGDILAINGALPAGITAAIVAVDNADPTPDTITVTLTGPASQAAFETALQQVVFTSSSSVILTPRVIDIAVDDGTPQTSNVAQTTISLTGNTSPVAQDDAASATEAGGLNNGTAGANPSGNVFADNNPAVTNDVDFDAEDAPLPTGAVGGSVVVVTQVQHGAGTPVSAGTTLIGTYGAVIINADGTYSYSVDQSNAAVQALVPAGAVLHDIFTYTIRDAFGALDTAQLTITINGADDTALAFADTGNMSEDAAATLFNVRANDTLDPDAPATNAVTLQPGAAAAGNGAANGLGIDIGDVTLSVNASNEIQVALTGSDFQKLAVGDTATITIPYRLAGDTQNSDSMLTVTVNGANDLPVANDDTGSMSEDAATTPFIVLTGAGLDVLDVDRGAPTAATPGLVTTGTVTAVGNGTASGKGIDGGDVTLGVNASNEITVALGADFHKLSASETATITVAYLLHGDGADADGANLTVTVTGVNDAPVVDLLNTADVQTTGVTATFTENGPVPTSVPVNVLPQVTLSDVDGTTLTGAIVTLTNAQVGVDILTLQGEGAATSGDIGGIHFEITSNNTVVTFSDGDATPDSVADYQAALRLIQFNNASDNPTQTDRTFTVQVNDGAANGNATATLDFVAINDAPVNTVPGAQNAVVTDTDYAFTGGNLVQVADADAGSGLIRTTLSAAHGNLTVVLNGTTVVTGTNGTHTVGLQGTVTQINAALATLVYNSDAGYTDADTLTVVTNDQGNSPAPALQDSDTVSLNVIPKVWYIDDSVGAISDATHFTSLAAFNTAHNAVSAANAPSIIYVRFGDDGIYTDTDGINLKAGEILLGQGVDLTYAKTLGGTGILEDNNNTLIPTITVTGGAGNAGVTLAQNNTLSGFNISVSGADGIGIEDSNAAGVAGAVGTLKVGLVGIGGVGKAIDIDQGGTLTGTGASDTATFTGISSTGSNTEGIQLGGIAGSLLGGKFAVSGTTTVTNAETTGIQVSNTAASANFNFGTATSVTDSAVGGHTANGIELITSIGATNSFAFGNLTVTTDGGYGLTAVNAGTLTFGGTNSIVTTGGAAIDVTGTALANATFGTVSSSGGATGINLVNQTGSFTASGGTLSGHSTSEVNLNGGSAAVTIASTINDGTGLSVQIQNRTGGTVAISGAITDGADAGGGILVANNNAGTNTINFTGQTTIASTTANGVSLTTNTGATINFNAGGNGLDITTTTGVGFNATGGGTVTVANSGSGNSINSTSGTALNIANTTIGANNVTFHDISSGNNTAAADPVNGIVLNTTGSSGRLLITGDGNTSLGGNNSGGVIQHTTGDGILLIGTLNPSFTNMSIHDIAHNGIDGTGVVNFTFDNGQITNTGTAAAGQYNENGIAFVDAALTANTVSGTVTITDSLISGAHRNAIMIETWNGTISNVNISNNTLQGGSLAGALKDATLATTADVLDAIHVFSQGTATQTANITTGTINNNTISGFEFLSGGIFIGGNGIRIAGGSGNTSNNTVGTIGTAANPIEITGNDIDNVGSNAIAVSFNGQQGISNFNIHHNGTIADPMSNMEGLGISVFFGGSGTFSALVNNNVIDNNGPTVNAGSSGIAVQLDDGPAGLGTSTGLATIRVNDNTITNPDGFGIRGIVRASNGTLNLYIQDNDVGTPSAANRNAIRVDSGSAIGDTTLNLNMSGNSGPLASATDLLVGSGVNAGIGLRKQGTVAATNEFNIQGIGAAPTNAQVQAWVGSPVPPGHNATAAAGGAAGTNANGNGVDIISGSNYGTTNAVPLLAADGGVASASGTLGEVHLSQAQLDSTVSAALLWWVAAGISTEQVELLLNTQYFVENLTDRALGSHYSNVVEIDSDAAEKGWFLDSSPFDSDEFAFMANAAGTHFYSDPTQAPAGHIDLLSVVLHEMGHVLGLDHDPSGDSLMSGELVTGERRLPGVDAAAAGPVSVSPQPDVPGPVLVSPEPVNPPFIGQNIVRGFDAEYYLAQYADVAAAGIDPLLHFELYGWQEGRNPNALFDTAGYLDHYADVAAAGINPLVHYHEYGWQEGRDPSASFDTAGYLATYADVAVAHVDPLDHFLKNGVHEGRSSVNDGLWGT